MKITCDIVSDLLPLYIDEVCTGDSKKAVEEHMKGCEKCRSTLSSMTEENPIAVPESSDIEKAKSPFRKLKLRFVFWLCFGIFCTSVIFCILGFAGTFYEIEAYFYHSVSAVIEIEESTDEWVTVTDYRYFNGMNIDNVETAEYLELIGSFPRKELSCPFPEREGVTVEVRIIDEDGNVVVEPMELKGGEEVSVNQLKRNKQYIVQCRSDYPDTYIFHIE